MILLANQVLGLHFVFLEKSTTEKASKKSDTHPLNWKMAEAFSKRQEKPTNRTSSYYKQAVARSIRNPPVGYVVNSHNIQWEYRFEEGQEDVKKFYPLLDSLEQVFSKPLFCCGGSLQPPDIDKFTLKVKPTKDKEHAVKVLQSWGPFLESPDN